MSIEITGPKAYQFQDQVCTLLAIQATKDGITTEIHIEPAKGEDARIKLKKDNEEYIIEIQVKKNQGGIGPTELADWLAHFPADETSNSLIENLVIDESRSVLFVSSGRCTDAISVHLVTIPSSATSLRLGLVKQANENTMRQKLVAYAADCSKSDGNIDKRRRAHIGNWISGIKAKDLKSAMHRVMIVEQVSSLSLLQEIKKYLQFEHNVVADQINRVIQEIENLIIKEKRTGCNILPITRQIIASGQATDSVALSNYIDRDEEQSLRENLSKNRAVLISGAPRVGKTFIALSLAANLQKLGFRVQTFGGIAETARFLMEPVNEPRAAFVDDPLGGSHAANNPNRELNQLEQLLPRLSNMQRLIVAQAQDRLLEVTRKLSVEGLMTAGHTWVSLKPGAANFLECVWNEAAKSYKVPIHLKTQISEALLSKRISLEPGCLVHLASRHNQLTAEASLDEIIRVAHQDAMALGSALRTEKLAPLLIALAVASTPELRVNETELAFLLDASRTDRPGESNITGTMSSMGQSDFSKRKVDIWSKQNYTPIPQLTQFEQGGLEQLELRRMVYETQKSYTFSHPFYRASAESLIDSATSTNRNITIQHLEKALLSIAVDSAKAAAINLDWIHHNLSESGGVGVTAVAKKGLNSIFPTVRELCFAFLAKKLSSLPRKEQSEVSNWLQKVIWPRLSYVVWDSDEPRLPPATVAGALKVDFISEQIKQSEVDESLKLLNSDRADKISMEASSRATQFLADNPEMMSRQAASRLLSFNISLIRALTAKTWLRLPRNDDPLILKRIFSENHPSVAQAAYRGVIKAWSRCDKCRQMQLLNGLREMVSSPVTAAALVDDLVLIARTEHGGFPTPWRIFEALMPVILQELPLGATLRDERLFEVVESSIGNISQDALTSIIDHWISLVAKIAGSGDIPSDYMLGVSDIIVSGIPLDTPTRIEHIARLLALFGTASRIRVVSDFVNRWEKLSLPEQQKILNHLVESAPDDVWIQAAALVRSVVPKEVQQVILPPGINLETPTSKFISALNPKLLESCINIFTGNHPTIYYVGAHGSRSKAWTAVMEEIVLMPQHEMFDCAWEWAMSHNKSIILAQAVDSLGAAYARHIADLLFARKLRTSGEFFPKVWERLFHLSVDESVKKGWVVRMSEIAPEVLNSLYEAKNWVPSSRLDDFFSLMQPDYMVLQIVDAFLEISTTTPNARLPKTMKAALLTLILKVIRESPPKLWFTYDNLRQSILSMGIENKEIMTIIAERRSELLRVSKDIPNRTYPILNFWVGAK